MPSARSDLITWISRIQAKLDDVFSNVDIDRGWQEKMLYGYSHNVPIVSTDKAIGFLMVLVETKGTDLETRAINRDSNTFGQSPKDEYSAVAIVNATRLGSKILAGDGDVYPIRGAIKRIDNNDIGHFKYLKQAYLVPA